MEEHMTPAHHTNKNNSNFFLNKIVSVTIDRPLGSKHPKHEMIYPINYGYIPNTISGDGEEKEFNMTSQKPICYLICGFLGAGKTTYSKNQYLSF